MNDLLLITYLKNNLQFGCIKSALFSEQIDEDGNLCLILVLKPFTQFYENDLNFIRFQVLQSKDLSAIPNCYLQHLSLTTTEIKAVYNCSEC